MDQPPPTRPKRPDPARPVNGLGPVYQAVLAWCTRPPRFPPPWDFVDPPAEAAGPIVEVDRATEDLWGRFPALTLRAAGVLQRTPDGGHRLAPELVNPCGAVLPLRTHPKAPVFGLLTARGLLPKRHFAFGAVRTDYWTARRLRAGDPLFATPHIRDVLLLRALGFPAVTSCELARAGTGTARALEKGFAWANGVGPRADSPRGPLALVGLTLCPLAAGPPPALRHAVDRLGALRRLFGFALLGVGAWMPTPAELEGLGLAAQLRERGAAQLVIQSGADALVDFEALGGRPVPPAPSYPDAFEALQAALATGAGSDGAHQAYATAVHRDLVRPLLDAAMDQADPAKRAALALLGSAAGMLHGSAPLAIDALARGPAGGPVDKFLTVAGKFVAVAGKLRRQGKQNQ